MDALRVLSSAGDNLEEIEKLLSCPICLEVYSKPVVILPCQHNLCRKCANDVFQNRGTPMGSGGRFRCPTCRYEVVLDRHGVYGLQRNLLVENIIDMYQSENRKPIFKKVEVMMCDEHEEEKVNIYCTTCQKPTCSLCKIFGQHQDCDVAPMEKVYKEQKRELSDSIALLVTGNDRLQAIISQTEELGKMTEANGRKAKSDLCAAFDKLYAVLEDRKNSLMAKITSDVQERNQVMQEMLKAYGEKLEGASKLMESSLALLEERSVSQFLVSARNTITNINATSRASEVRKPMFSIQDMTEFEVDFASNETELAKLNFKRVNKNDDTKLSTDSEDADASKEQDNDVIPQRGEPSQPLFDNDIDDSMTHDEDAADSDDTAATSVTSRSDVGSCYSGRCTSEVADGFGRSQSPVQSRAAGNRTLSYNMESQRNISEELHYPKVKGNRWYDVYVRKTPTDGRNSDAKDDLTKQSLQDSISLSLPASDSKSETDGDLQVSSEQPGKKIAEEDHPVTRHRSVASLSIQQVASLNPPEQSREAGQKSNEEVAAEDGCPANASHEVCGQSISTDENGVGQSYTAGSSYLRRRQKRLVDEELSASRRRSLAIDSAPHNLHHSRCSSPVRTSQRYTSSDASGQGQNHAAPNSPKTQRRRPRQYGTHRRRTWSHLLDKKP